MDLRALLEDQSSDGYNESRIIVASPDSVAILDTVHWLGSDTSPCKLGEILNGNPRILVVEGDLYSNVALFRGVELLSNDVAADGILVAP